MTERSKNEIINALTVIKDVCKEYERKCHECPLRVGQSGSCCFSGKNPRDLNIKSPDPKNWRALYETDVYENGL